MLRFEQKPPDQFLKMMKSEVEAIFQPTGLQLGWEVLGGGHRPGTYSRVVIVEMHGRCSPPDRAGDATGPVRLGWTVVNDGEVSPFAVVDCNQVGGVIAAVRGSQFKRGLIYAEYVRLAGRVLAHELMHSLLKTSDHHETDIARSSLRPIDLERKGHLTPQEITALRAIGRTPGTAIARKD